MGETLSAVVSRGGRATGEPALYVGTCADAPQRGDAARVALGAIDRVDIVRGESIAWTVREADGARVATLALADARLSSLHARITRLGDAWFAEDLASKNGTWIGGARISRARLTDGDALIAGHTALVFRARGGELGDARPGTARVLSPAIVEVYARIAEAAGGTVPIEIVGESGTGKELVARAVHERSGRGGKLVALNCGAIAPSVLEAELFGAKKGAFTGATEDRAGMIREADGGTLFLDEIAELPAAAQVALLRVLQEGEVRPVGGGAAIRVDVRVVTATHAALDARVAAGTFRADLRARLLGVQLVLAPLRERREDLAILACELLAKGGAPRELTMSRDVLDALYRHLWPLNVRELERALAAAVAVARGRGCIELGDLPAAIAHAPAEPAPAAPIDLDPEERAVRDQLVAAIDRHDGNLAAVARDLGKDRTQIRRWMTKFGLSR